MNAIELLSDGAGPANADATRELAGTLGPADMDDPERFESELGAVPFARLATVIEDVTDAELRWAADATDSFRVVGLVVQAEPVDTPVMFADLANLPTNNWGELARTWITLVAQLRAPGSTIHEDAAPYIELRDALYAQHGREVVETLLAQAKS